MFIRTFGFITRHDISPKWGVSKNLKEVCEMNYKLFAVVLAVLVCCMPVMVSASDASKYVNNNPVLSIPDPAAYGYVIVYVRAGGSAQDLTIWVSNDLTNQTFDPAYHHDRTPIEGQNPGFMKIRVLQDGVSAPELLAAGNYTAYLQKGNGDQLETIKFIIGGGDTSRLQFLGSAVSSKSNVKCKLIYTILNARYGAIGKECHEVTIVDKEAWDETVIDKEAYDETIHHDAETHVVHHPAETHVVHHPAETHQETVVDKEAWDETIVDVEAYDEIVHHNAITHTERQISTWQEITPITYHGDYAIDGQHSDNYKYIGTDKADYDITYVGHTDAWTEHFGDYTKSGSKYVYTGVDQADYNPVFYSQYHGDYDLVGGHYVYHTGSGHGSYGVSSSGYVSPVNHPIIYNGNARPDGVSGQYKYHGANTGDYLVTNVGHDDAVYGWVITTSWEDGTCGISMDMVSTMCTPLPAETKCEERVVIDKEAWDETIHHDAVTHVVHHDAETHEVTIVDKEAYDETVTDTEPWDETVIDKEAYDETIHHDAVTHVVHHDAETHTEQVCTTVGSFVDVKGAVQSVVNGGNTKFLFDNRPENGGIFATDGTTLLYGLGDPSYGIVKTVTIDYQDGCGNEKSILAAEYEVIDLVAGTPVNSVITI
jgi:hypothetical protein